MIVDAHLHVWRAMREYLAPIETIVTPQTEVPLELLIQYMTEHEVDRGVVVQPMFTGEDNSYIADSAASQSQRLTAVCVLDPRRPDSPDRLEYWVRERGCKGLRLRPRFPGESRIFGDPSTFALWERARALGVVVSVLASPEHLPVLASLVNRFSELDVVIDHMAYPDVGAGVNSLAFENLLALARFPRVFIKVSGFYYYSRQTYPYADCWDFVHALYDRFGPARLIWGSDFPHVLFKSGYRRALLLPSRAFSFLKSTDLELIMGDNAARLYWR